MDTCKICGGEIDTRNGYSQMMLEEQLCYSCFFWKQQYEEDKKKPALSWAVINGHHYELLPHTNDPAWAGCAGAMHKIKFNDGTVVECDNLWHQGEISREWREKFPDNAEFINC